MHYSGTAFVGMFIGDSIAVPMHWYYEFMAPGKIKEHLDTYYNGSLDKLYGVNEDARDKHGASGSNLKKCVFDISVSKSYTSTNRLSMIDFRACTRAQTFDTVSTQR